MVEERPAVIAVDIGNTRTKFGCFDPESSDAFPQPLATLEFTPDTWNAHEAAQWVEQHAPGLRSWWIGSVNRPAAARLLQWIERREHPASVVTLTHQMMPLAIAVSQPERVGIDRLAGAVAANSLRTAVRPAIVVDLGTALKVHLVSAEGAFLGGAILPGIAMSARALHDFTDLLPLISMRELAVPPPALGTSTDSAMRSGLYWGAIGAMRELITRLQDPQSPAQVYLTGGAAPDVADLLGGEATHVPHLVLSGIALAVRSRRT